MAKRKPLRHDTKLVNFCNKPAATLAGFKADTPPSFSHAGRNYKIVPVGLIPNDIEHQATTLDINSVQRSPSKGGAASKRAVKLNIGTVINYIKGLKEKQAVIINSDHGGFALVHESVESVKPAVSPKTDMAEANSRRKRKANPEPTAPEVTEASTPESMGTSDKDNTPDDALEVDVNALEVNKDADLTNFAQYRWSAFLSDTMNKDYTITAKDHVVNKKGIAVIEYAGRKKPIGFMLPEGLVRGNGIDSNGRYRSSHVAQIIKGKWASNPLKPAVITISNMRSAPMVMITMGAAVELRKKGLFDKAPEWIHDHLNVAQADIHAEQKKQAGLEDVDTTTKPALAAIKPTPKAPKPEPAKVTTPPRPDSVEPSKTAKPKTETPKVQAENAMAAVAKALASAKQTLALVKVEVAKANAVDMVHVGADEESIQAMENVIDLSKTMGALAPEIVRLDYKPTSMVESMNAMKMAWDEANDRNVLVILEPEGGKRIAMTKNNELLEAYQMRF